MNLQVEFKKETGESAFDLVNLKFKKYYVEYLEERIEQLILHGAMPSVYVITYNDDYGRPIFDNCFNDVEIAKEYINDHDYLRMDDTTVIKEMVFE